MVKEKKGSFADWVRCLIRDKDLTIRKVADLSGDNLHYATVNRILNEGLDNITVRTIRGLAKGLGVPPDEVFRRAYGNFKTENRINALAFNYENLSESDRREIDSLLKVVENEIEMRRTKSKK